MPTERLYYNDCYAASFDATIREISAGGRRIYLDRTLFYPTSGGQPHDLGSLDGQRIADVIDEGDRIAHLLADPLVNGSESVRGEVDWNRRYGHMQQHTGQHLLSAVFLELLGIPTLSFHMGAAVSTIEFETKNLTVSDIDRVEARVNELIWAALPVRISYADAFDTGGLRKPSARSGTLRLVEISDVDRSACGGTHVRSTAELGPIQIRRSEKIRGNVRIDFVCGGRALRMSKTDFRMLSQLARESGTPHDGVSESVARLRRRGSDLEKQNQKLSEELAVLEAADLYRQSQPDRNGIRWQLRSRPTIDNYAKTLASSFTAHPKAAMLIVGEQPCGVLLATSHDSGLHAGERLKALLLKYGGRGGGSATLAQGVVPENVTADTIYRDASTGEFAPAST